MYSYFMITDHHDSVRVTHNRVVVVVYVFISWKFWPSQKKVSNIMVVVEKGGVVTDFGKEFMALGLD